MAFTRPTLPPWSRLEPRFREMFASGELTKGRWQRVLEERLAEALGVRRVVALSSCTSGLLLGIQSLGLQGEVLVPSFSFSATFHALRWNRLTPIWVDCEPDTFTVDLGALERALTPRTCAVMGACLFGNPPDLRGLTDFCRRRGLALFFDSAHGLGTLYEGRPLGGWGDFEVFSLSPTKLLPAGEGGILASNRDDVADWARDGRDYGNPGNYDCRFAGLNARMSEMHAVTALEGLDHLEGYARARNRLADLYRTRLEALPGLRLQRVRPGCRSSYKDLAVVVEEGFGLSRDDLARALAAEGIPTRPYFDPPGHRQAAYRDLPPVHLPVTEHLSAHVLCLPIASHMSEDEVVCVCGAIERIHRHADQVARALRESP
jgi:dTDP-4-amino-4,6-dideoxygalactose transaminase